MLKFLVQAGNAHLAAAKHIAEVYEGDAHKLKVAAFECSIAGALVMRAAIYEKTNGVVDEWDVRQLYGLCAREDITFTSAFMNALDALTIYQRCVVDASIAPIEAYEFNRVCNAIIEELRLLEVGTFMG